MNDTNYCDSGQLGPKKKNNHLGVPEFNGPT